MTASRQRESNQRFLEKFGSEKLTEKLGSEGVYAYGLSLSFGLVFYLIHGQYY